jgi:hypothetical protein
MGILLNALTNFFVGRRNLKFLLQNLPRNVAATTFSKNPPKFSFRIVT